MSAAPPAPLGRLRVLIPSDPHDDLAALEQLAAQHRGAIDLVLCPGDLSTMPSTLGQRPSDETLAEFTGKVDAVLAALAQVTGSVFWIPGNHDPDNLFEPNGQPQPVHAAGNLHNRVVQVAPGLWLAGFGGCVEATEHGQVIWGAYPYAEQELRASRLVELKRQLSDVPAGHSVLLVTHCGPSASATTVVSGMDPDSLSVPGVRGAGQTAVESLSSSWIQTGSAALTELLLDPKLQEQVLLQVHGHTHHGCGLARVGAVPVLNPGCLRHTRTYAVVTLAADGGAWHLVGTEIRALDERASNAAPLPLLVASTC